MNPNTNPQQMQTSFPQPQGLPDPTKGANEAAASLSFATHLQGQMMQHQNPKPETPQTPGQPTPEGEPKPETPSVDPKALKEEIMKDVKEAIKEEMSSLRDEIASAIKDDGEQD